ncbi:hypothetical protein IG631_20621 [Alternaria alternata]|nr:hypothetical protein IG631_20621 [Alternaria alternata]
MHCNKVLGRSTSLDELVAACRDVNATADFAVQYAQSAISARFQCCRARSLQNRVTRVSLPHFTLSGLVSSRLVSLIHHAGATSKGPAAKNRDPGTCLLLVAVVSQPR